MDLIKTIISLYDELFQSELGDYIMSTMNDKEQLAIKIIKENDHLSIDAINNKLSKKLYKDSPASRSYQSFRKRMRDKIRMISMVMTPKGSEMQRVESDLYKEYYEMVKFYRIGLRKPAYFIAKSLYKKSMRFQVYNIALDCAKYLCQEYYLYQDSMDKAQEYEEMVDLLNDVCNKEFKARLAFYKIAYRYTFQDGNIDYGFVDDMIEKLSESLPMDSYRYHFHYYQLKCFKYLNKDSDKYLNQCHQGIEYFQGLHFDHSAYISIFRNYIVREHLKNKEYGKSALILESVISDLEPYSSPWLRYEYNLLVCYAHTNPSLALEKYNLVTKAHRWRSQNRNTKNKWLVLGMYLRLLSGDIRAINTRKIKYNLNYNNNDNEIRNIPFQAADLMYSYLSGDNGIESKLKNFRETISIRLSRKQYERAEIYMSSFQNMERKKYYIEKLKSISNDADNGVELINYENLLSLVPEYVNQ